MARLGQMQLVGTNGTADSGLGLLLARPPEVTRSLGHGVGNCQIMAGLPLVVCSFPGADSHLDTLRIGTDLIQEGLDLLSMMGGPDLVTRDAQDEYFAWWNNGGKRTISVASTVTLTFSVPPVTFEVRDASGNVVPPTPVTSRHHPGFRFYRLSQASDDLFDAFRNMYLAFELLLSAKHPKGKEKEIEWLRRSLTSAAPDLRLASLAPSGHPAPVDYIVQEIYTNARLPLFHAKDGHTYFASSVSSGNRAAVKASLELLTALILRMAETWHQTRRVSGGVFFSWVYDSLRKTLSTASFVLSKDSAVNPDEDLKSPCIAAGTRFEGQLLETFDGEQRMHVQGSVDVSVASLDGPVRVIRIINDKYPVAAHSLEAELDLTGFDRLEVVTFLRLSNENQPRSLFAR